jgi:hypothetical protein
MNTDEQTQVRDLLNEAPTSYTVTPLHNHTVMVNYYAITPRKSRARFNRTVSLTQLRGAQSETAVLYYLKSLHPSCDIMIMNIEFR